MPFAAVATAVLLTLVATGSRPPWTSWRAMLVLTALIGLGLNVRAGALMFVVQPLAFPVTLLGLAWFDLVGYFHFIASWMNI